MDNNMVLTLSIVNLIVVFLILSLLFLAASYAEKSKYEGESQAREVEQEIKLSLDHLAESIANIRLSIKPIVDLTKKHESILSGTQSKGALGEQFVQERLADLPHEWYDRKVPFPGGTVEFALRTPNKRWIPIDKPMDCNRFAS